MKDRRLLELLPRETRGPVAFAFSAMEVADEVLSARYPTKTSEPECAFRALRPRMEFFGNRPSLLRPHMEEILDRLEVKGDPSPATAAEMLAGLSEASHAAPLRHEYFVLTSYLFLRVFGREKAAEIIGEKFVERAEVDWEENPRLAGLEAELRRKLADPNRTLAKLREMG